MENNEIMDRLLQDEKDIKSPAKTEAFKSQTNQAENTQLSRIRVVTAKYKLYIILLLIFICALGLNYNPKAKNTLKMNDSLYEQSKVRLTSVERSITDAKNDMAYLCDGSYGVITNADTLKNCLDEGSDCMDLPEQWKVQNGEEDNLEYDITIPLSYLQLHSLHSKKMSVDEKMILKNLNEYLIKEDILGGSKNTVGDILRIQIGNPKAIYGGNNFFEVPVNVQIEFSTVDDLVGFLYNIEKKLIDEPEDRILYKIQSVSYDVVSNDEPQITNISMVAYYYYNESFDGRTECSEGDIYESSDSRIDNSTDDSTPLFYKIFSSFKK